MDPNQSARYLTKLMAGTSEPLESHMQHEKIPETSTAPLKVEDNVPVSTAGDFVAPSTTEEVVYGTNDNTASAVEVDAGRSTANPVEALVDASNEEDHHLATPSGGELLCEVCGRACKSKAGLARHRKVH